MATDNRSREELLSENAELRLRLEAAEEILQVGAEPSRRLGLDIVARRAGLLQMTWFSQPGFHIEK